MRRFALLAVSVVAVVVLGGLTVWAQWGSTDTVDRARRADRITLQKTLAELTQQYMAFTFLSTKSAADSTDWRLHINDVRDRASLQAIVRSSPLTGYAAAIMSLSGAPLSVYPGPSALPPGTDPGYAVMRRDLAAGQPGLSDVMHVGRTPVVAFAVPISRGTTPVALLVAFADLQTWPLQGYNAKLEIGTGAHSYVVDGAGTIAAARDTAELGRHLPALNHFHTTAAAFVSYRAGKTTWDMSYSPAGQGWMTVTTQPASAFAGALNRSRRLASLALALLLSIAVLLLIVFHHKRQHALARLAEERLHDPLTGLGQRSLLEMRLSAALARRNRHHLPLAVLFCDVDAFKDVNDRYGHNVGDQLLATIAQRMSAAVRETDMVARLGGDEFAVIMEETSYGDAAEVADRIRRSVATGVILNGTEVIPSISVGGAVLTDGEASLDALLHEADMAMYQGKRSQAGQQMVNVGAVGSRVTSDRMW
jgi:diguanylate cyclase (GGDEF)-like protein